MTDQGQLSHADREHIEKLLTYFGQQARKLAFPSAGKADAEIAQLELELAATEMTRLFLDSAILQNEVMSETKSLAAKYMSHHILGGMSEAFEEIENFLEAARILAAQTNPVARRNYEAAMGKKL